MSRFGTGTGLSGATSLATEAPRVALLRFGAEEAARLASFLGRLGFEVQGLPSPRGDGDGAAAAADGELTELERRARCFDLAVLRLDDPERQAPGWVWLLRERLGLPVVVVSPEDGYEARLGALRAGAEDYVCAPFSLSELAMRLRAIYRRLGPRLPAAGGSDPDDGQGPGELRLGPLTVNRRFRQAAVGGRALELTGREFELLWLLASHPGRVFSREELLERLWGDEEAASEECVTVLVSRLRRKLREAGAGSAIRIRALWGVGYRLEASVSPMSVGSSGAGNREVMLVR